MIAKKKCAVMFIVFMFLTSLAMTSVPVQSQPPTTFYVDQPSEGIEAKPAGTTFEVDILVNASGLPFYDPNGIVGWALYVQVDPTVLKPVEVIGGTKGCFLFDFLTLTGLNYTTGVTLLSKINNVTGLVDLSEQMVPTPGYGAATDDPYGPLMPAPQKLVTIVFESLSLYKNTTIDIILPEYMNAYTDWYAVVDGDGYYKGWPDITIGATLVGKKGWAEHHRFRLHKDGDSGVPDSHGSPGVQTLYAKIKNYGDLNLTVRALWRLSKGGAVEPMVVSDVVLLEPGDVVILEGDARAFTEADIGKWNLGAFCEYWFADTWNLAPTTRTTGFVVVA